MADATDVPDRVSAPVGTDDPVGGVCPDRVLDLIVVAVVAVGSAVVAVVAVVAVPGSPTRTRPRIDGWISQKYENAPEDLKV